MMNMTAATMRHTMPTQSKNWRDCTKPPVNNKMTATTAIMIGNMTDTFLVNAEKSSPSW